MSNLLGIKKILTYKLINIIKPYIYEGILSIYLDASNISNSNDVLMVFQGLLSKIPKWSDQDLLKEVTRIKTKCSCGYLENLIKSLVKINISIFLEETKDTFVEPSLYENITLTKFIKKVYILVARTIFNKPILFYKGFKDIEVLQNMNIVMKIIGEDIENAIIELLPLDYLIDEFLNVEIYDKQINLKVPNESIENLKQLKQKLDLVAPIEDIRIKLVKGVNNSNITGNNIVGNNIPDNNITVNNPFPMIPIDNKPLFPIQQGGKKYNSRDNRSRKNRSRKSRKSSYSGSSTYQDKSDSRRYTSSDRIERDVKKFLSNSKINESVKIDNIIKKKHNEVKHIKQTNLETSASYDVDNMDRFQEVFSNDKEIRENKKKNNMKFINSSDNNLFTNNSKKKSIKSRDYRQLHKV